MSFLSNLFGRRRSRFGFGRRQSTLSNMFANRRGGITLGSVAALAAPFLWRKLRERRAQRAAVANTY